MEVETQKISGLSLSFLNVNKNYFIKTRFPQRSVTNYSVVLLEVLSFHRIGHKDFVCISEPTESHHIGLMAWNTLHGPS